MKYANENEFKMSSLNIPAVSHVEVGNMGLQMAEKKNIGTALSIVREGDILGRGIK